MKFSPHIWSQIRNISVEKLMSALEKDGWKPQKTRGATLTYKHSDGRYLTIHYHPKKTYGSRPKTLKALLRDINWTEEDMRRLKLIK